MPAESVLDTPLEEVLSGRLPARLASELSLTTVGELLDHTPRRWVERGALLSAVRRGLRTVVRR